MGWGASCQLKGFFFLISVFAIWKPVRSRGKIGLVSGIYLRFGTVFKKVLQPAI